MNKKVAASLAAIALLALAAPMASQADCGPHHMSHGGGYYPTAGYGYGYGHGGYTYTSSYGYSACSTPCYQPCYQRTYTACTPCYNPCSSRCW